MCGALLDRQYQKIIEERDALRERVIELETGAHRLLSDVQVNAYITYEELTEQFCNYFPNTQTFRKKESS